MRFEVKRSNWLRGEGAEESYLIRHEDGKMCCLGFLGRACGVANAEMRGLKNPFIPGLAEMFAAKVDASVAYGPAMELNDNASITDQEREAELVKLFAQHGIEVVFND